MLKHGFVCRRFRNVNAAFALSVCLLVVNFYLFDVLKCTNVFYMHLHKVFYLWPGFSFVKLCLGFSKNQKSRLYFIKDNIKLCPRGTLGRDPGCSVFYWTWLEHSGFLVLISSDFHTCYECFISHPWVSHIWVDKGGKQMTASVKFSTCLPL